MKRNLVYETILSKKKTLLSLIIALVSFLCIIFGIYVISFCIENKNEKNINNYLTSITYDISNKESEKNELISRLDYHFISNKDKGLIYKSLAQISFLTEDDLTYNNYVSLAIYYLEKSNCNKEIIDLYNQYAGKLYSNGAYNDAVKYLNKILDMNYFNSLSNSELKFSVYLTYIDIYMNY